MSLDQPAIAQNLGSRTSGANTEVLRHLNLQKMEKLHELNRVKDVVAYMLGAMAEQQNCTVKDLYKRFGLPSS